MAESKMLLNKPANLTGKAAQKYERLWNDDPKKARQFLKKQGYNLNEVRQQNKQQQEIDQNPDNQNYQMRTGAEATGTSMRVADEQAQQQVNYNRPDQQGYFGGTEQWVKNPDGSFRKVQNLSGQGQQMVDYEDQYSLDSRRAGAQVGGQAFQNYQNPYSFDGMSGVFGEGDLMAGRNAAADRVFQFGMRRLQPQFDNENQSFEQMAAERGWTPGSEVYDEQRTRFEQSMGDRMMDLEDRAYEVGGSEFDRLYNTSVNERNRQIGEYTTLRDRPLQESQMLMSNGPGARLDSFSDYGPVNVQQTDPMQAYGMDMQKYISDSGLDWDARKQQVQNRFDARQLRNTQSWQSGENALDRGAQMDAIMAGRGPAGMSEAERMQLARDQMLWERDNGFRQDPNASKGSSWAGIAGSVGSGIGTGIGSGIAKWF